jgi:concanavalin A-like lectin/glucanase superfamily protein
MTRLRTAFGLTIVALATIAAPAAADPLGRWSLDEGSGQVAADVTGNGHIGQLGSTPGPDGNDPSWVSGRFGGGLRLLGDQDQFVALANPGGLAAQQLTVGAWVRRLGTPGRWRYVVSNGAVACEFASYGLYTGFDGGLAFYVSDADHFVRTSEVPQSAVWDGNWHHAVGTYDGQRVRLFLDGAEVGDGTPTNLKIAYGDSASAFIGTYRGSCERPFTGDVDEVSIQDAARGADQIADDAARDATKPLPPQTPPVSGPPAVGVPKVLGRCLSITATPKRVVVGRRTRLALLVRSAGTPVVGKHVSVTGLGLRRTVKTGKGGRVRLYVRVKRRGHLRVSAKGQPVRCAKRVTAKMLRR